jgi:acyl homoserine lactone synthase
MIIVIAPHNIHEHRPLLDQMFRLRARVFHDRLKWDVSVDGGLERDKYDEGWPFYILCVDDETSKLQGSLRLLPTTGPTLLADFFSDTPPDAADLVSPSIWECTRFCIDEDADHFAISGALIAALGEVGLRVGIESIIANFDASTLRLYRRLGCEVEIVGSTERYERPVYLGLFTISQAILDGVNEKLKRHVDSHAKSLATIVSRSKQRPSHVRRQYRAAL